MIEVPVHDYSPQPELVRRARTGDRDAFSQLVVQHQTAVVTIAYAIAGDFARSEDIAQEAFLAAWRGMATLDDDDRFKAWLYGITRNLALNAVRRQGRRPDGAEETPAEPLEERPGPREHAVSREEASLVWRSLKRLPELYREPLTLFYREHQSIERVAAALDLTEATVKQRLTRGRAMLRYDLERTIERSLGFTTPGTVFTLAVMTGISATTGTAAVAGMTATSAKSGLWAKAVLLWPTVALPFVSLASIWFSGREALRGTRSETQRRFVKRLWTALGTVVVGSDIVMTVLLWRLHGAAPGADQMIHRWLLAWSILTLAALATLALWAYRPFVLWARSFETPANAAPWTKRFAFVPNRHFVYRSRTTLLGLPLVDVRFGHSAEEPLVRGTARGWIALGDIAHGLIFGCGGVATGAVALGVITVGALSIGVLGVGALAIAWLALGWIASGWFAFGYLAFGTFLGVGFEAATGMVAIARHLAEGMLYVAAEHVRDMTVVRWTESNRWAQIFRGPTFTPATALLIPILSMIGTNWLVRTPAQSRGSTGEPTLSGKP